MMLGKARLLMLVVILAVAFHCIYAGKVESCEDCDMEYHACANRCERLTGPAKLACARGCTRMYSFNCRKQWCDKDEDQDGDDILF